MKINPLRLLSSVFYISTGEEKPVNLQPLVEQIKASSSTSSSSTSSYSATTKNYYNSQAGLNAAIAYYERTGKYPTAFMAVSKYYDKTTGTIIDPNAPAAARETSYPLQLEHQLEQEIIATTPAGETVYEVNINEEGIPVTKPVSPSPTAGSLAQKSTEIQTSEKTSVLGEIIEKSVVSGKPFEEAAGELISQQVIDVDKNLLSSKELGGTLTPSATPTETPSTKFMELYAPGFVPLTQRAEYIGSGVIPGNVVEAINKVSVPGNIILGGGSDIYKQLAFEKYFMLPGYQETEKGLVHTLKSSYDFMSTQPVYSIEGKTGLTFSELKTIHPALYLTQNSGGEWIPGLDVVRWKAENLKYGGVFTMPLIPIFPGQKGVSLFDISEMLTNFIDVDYYFSGNKKEYLASKLYQSHLNIRTGDPLGIVGTWAGLQAPAWENIILPFAGGAILGKVFTATKLTGGLAQAGLGLRAAYAAGAVLMAETALFTGGKIVGEFASGETGKGFASLTKLGLQLTSGMAGYTVGASSAVKAFETKFPNVYWGSEGVPVVGEKYASLQHEVIKGPGLKPGSSIATYRYGFYKISQLFKPGYEKTAEINFPSAAIAKTYWLSSGKISTFLSYPHGESIISWVSPYKQYITFPGSSSVFGASGDITMLGYTGLLDNIQTGTAMGSTKIFVSKLGGQRAWSYKAVWGMEKFNAFNMSEVTSSYIKGVMNVNKLVRLQGKTIWGDITAVQPMIPGLQNVYFDSLVADFASNMVKPVFGFSPNIGSMINPFSIKLDIGIVKPAVKINVDAGNVIKPLIEPTVKTIVDVNKGIIPVFKTDINEGSFINPPVSIVNKILDFKPEINIDQFGVVEPVVNPIVDTGINVIDLVTPVFKMDTDVRRSITSIIDVVTDTIKIPVEVVDTVYDYDFDFNFDFDFETPITPIFPLKFGAPGGGGGYGPSRGRKKGARKRVHPIKLYTDIFIRG